MSPTGRERAQHEYAIQKASFLYTALRGALCILVLSTFEIASMAAFPEACPAVLANGPFGCLYMLVAFQLTCQYLRTEDAKRAAEAAEAVEARGIVP